MPSIVESWERIHKWLGKHAPQILANLNAGASNDEIASAERLFGFSMPPDWRELYRVHNGLNQHGGIANLFYGLNFFDLSRVAREFTQAVTQRKNLGADYVPDKVFSADQGINADEMFNLRWIALGHDWSRVLIRVDMSPGVGGETGQVICTDCEFRVAIRLANSVTELLHDFAQDLELGKYFLNEESREKGEDFLDCVPEIDLINWWMSPRWKHLQV